MKKILALIFTTFALGVCSLYADNDKIITKGKLPLVSQQFVDKHFAQLKASYVKLERDFLEKSYKIVFTDGTKLEFSRNGEWKEVDCRYSEVPQSIIPEAIRNYISSNYPGEKILQIDRDYRNYEVRLSNRLELTFDKHYNLIDIDD
ncbi:MAG: PepSY-like domain-containing protein [Bacteroidaceae bacterium]|nr:PepSY-like domain-containing protein [Bacteroidaceae bacterium]